MASQPAKPGDHAIIQTALHKLVHEPERFTADDAYSALKAIMNGASTHAQTGAFLTALRIRKLDWNAVVVAACGRALREHALEVPLTPIGDEPAILREDLADIVGTGGDGQNTFNVSTAAGIVAAAAGAKVAKHGNRASSSTSGSADLLEALGCNISGLTPDRAVSLLRRIGYCFLFAQIYHPSMSLVAPVRRQLAIPTIFNLLGPLSNPARPGRMVVGVASEAIGPLMAEALRLSGVTQALVVSGAEGLDEISPAGPTYVWTLKQGNIVQSTLTPADFGLQTHHLDSVRGGNGHENAATFREILAGRQQGAVLDFILLNAAALLVVTDRASNWKDGVQLAREAVSSGAAQKLLNEFVSGTQS